MNLKHLRYNPSAIRIIREVFNLSKSQFAKKLRSIGNSDTQGVTRQTVHAWETGKCQPSLNSISAIANAFGLKSIDIFFLGRSDDDAGDGVDVHSSEEKMSA